MKKSSCPAGGRLATEAYVGVIVDALKAYGFLVSPPAASKSKKWRQDPEKS